MKHTRDRWKGESANVNFRLPKELKERFYEACKLNGLSPSEEIRKHMNDFATWSQRVSDND